MYLCSKLVVSQGLIISAAVYPSAEFILRKRAYFMVVSPDPEAEEPVSPHPVVSTMPVKVQIRAPAALMAVRNENVLCIV